MKKSLKIISALVIVLVCLYGYRQWSRNTLALSVEKARRELREQPFRTELTDFSFTLPAEAGARSDAVLSAGQTVPSSSRTRAIRLMETAGTNIMLALPLVEMLRRDQNTHLRQAVKQELENHSTALDGACAALISGPIRFEPAVSFRGDTRLP